MENHCKVLIVDDELLNLDVLTQELEFAGYEIINATSGAEAIDKALSEAPDTILLDIMMPDMDGYETCRTLKSSDLTKGIPVIFMTALTGTQEKVRGFEVGGIDYIAKPFQPEEVLARVATHVANRRLQQELSMQNEQLREEIEAHRRSKATVAYLRNEIKETHNFEEIIGASKALVQLLEKALAVAGTDTTVLIHGETGTGKELIARALHNHSKRCDYPLVKVNCAALPRDLIESEIFGHEKGAFTGATRRHKGRFELADKGTLFLDEVGELSLEAQAKLLRVLQEREFERVGGEKSVQVDVRVIAATNRPLASEVEAGSFRSDLYYRLNVFPLSVPPLRERKSDIPLLAQFFVEKIARKLGRRIDGMPKHSMEKLVAYSWPGNVRELENVVERSIIMSPESVINIGDCLITDLGTQEQEQLWPVGTLEEIERAYIVAVLKETNGIIEGESGAAKYLGLNASTLRGRIRKLGIDRPARSAKNQAG